MEEIVRLLLSLHPQQACSLAAVVSGAKPSAILESVEEPHWPTLVALAREGRIALSYRASGGGIVLLKEGGVTAPSPTREEVAPKPLVTSFGDFTAYVAGDSQTLQELVGLAGAEPRSPQATRRLGELLGYPQCCVDSYLRRGPVRAWHDYLSGLVAAGLEDSPLELWAVYHAPCSPGCGRTLELGRAYLDSLRRLSEGAYGVVVHRLASSHLSYSLGRRFIDFHVLESGVPHWFHRMASEHLPNPRVVAASILRPYAYFEWEGGPYRLRLTRDLQGFKYLAYSPGDGVLIASPGGEVYVYLTRGALGKECAEYASTVFRVYAAQRQH